METLAANVGTIVSILPVALFAALALWKRYAVLYMLTAGAALLYGLAFPDLLTGPYGIAIGLAMLAFATFFVVMAYRNIMHGGKDEN